ncbi:hypothetical protein ES703_55407 [subsurface metagenome]
MNRQCKFINDDKTRCKGVMVLEDGFCIIHSPTAKAVKEKATKEKAEIAKKFKFPSQNPHKQIRKFCLDCCESWRDIQFCASVDCALWFLRFGKLPQAHVRDKGVNHARLFDRKNFGAGKRYDSDTEIEDLSV